MLKGKQGFIAEHHKNRYSHKEDLEPDVIGSISKETARKLDAGEQEGTSEHDRVQSAEIEKPRVVGISRKTVKE